MEKKKQPHIQTLVEKNERARVLLVDDDIEIHEIFDAHLPKEGFSLIGFTDAFEALESIKRGESYDVIVSDLMMPGIDGLDFVSQLKQVSSDIPVILITAHGSIDSAIEAIRRGALDYVQKPLNLAQLSVVLERSLKFRKISQDNKILKRQLSQNSQFGTLIGTSPGMQEVFTMLQQVSNTSANVLITGESGTGKDMVAREIHRLSDRRENPFVPLNCTAIPDTLLESELFGHKKGAFTGASEHRKGLFQEASGGTLFLDEIGDMPLDLQAKLLRVLQEKKVRPVGENKDIEVDVRIIAATHNDLKKSIVDGRFREDLYFRLAVIPIKVPALRNRKEDIPTLATHFLNKFSEANKKSLKGFSAAALNRLLTSRWEGNVRQLQNTIERAVIMAHGEQIEEKDLMLEELFIRDTPQEKYFAKLPTLEELENEYIQYVLLQTEGSKEKAASILGVNRKTLYRREAGASAPN